jgi:hypothetical protein
MKRLGRKALAESMTNIRNFLRRTKERAIETEMRLFGNVPLIPAASGPSMGDMTTWAFHTGNLPSASTAARKIMEWELLEIVDSRVNKNGKISRREAQKEVSRLLGIPHGTHQYLTYEAAKLCGNYSEATEYTLHLIAGSMAEDFYFMPNESLRDIYAEEPGREFRDVDELRKSLEPGTTPGFLKRVFMFIAKLWRKVSGGTENDSINRPYFAHFHDPGRKQGDKGLNLLNGELRFESALDRIKSYWNVASQYYETGDKPRAFCALGHITHLIQDMHVPAHVHNDIHGPTLILGKPDSLERWCTKSNYPHLSRPDSRENVHIWDSGPLWPPKADGWDEHNFQSKLTGFLNDVVAKTKTFRSVDAKGSAEGQGAEGRLTDDECFHQASTLIPLAISNSAQMIVNFLEYHGEK